VRAPVFFFFLGQCTAVYGVFSFAFSLFFSSLLPLSFFVVDLSTHEIPGPHRPGPLLPLTESCTGLGLGPSLGGNDSVPEPDRRALLAPPLIHMFFLPPPQPPSPYCLWSGLSRFLPLSFLLQSVGLKRR